MTEFFDSNEKRIKELSEIMGGVEDVPANEAYLKSINESAKVWGEKADVCRENDAFTTAWHRFAVLVGDEVEPTEGDAGPVVGDQVVE